MFSYSQRRILLYLTIALTACLTQGVETSIGSGSPTGELRADAGSGATVEMNDETGLVGFVQAPEGRVIRPPAGLTENSNPKDVARGFLGQFPTAFGLAGGERSSRVKSSYRTPTGGTSVRIEQTIDGLEVLGGEYAVNLDADNNILSVVGEGSATRSVDSTAETDVNEAEQSAIAAVAKSHRLDKSYLDATSSGRTVLDPEIAGLESAVSGGARVVYVVVVTGKPVHGVDETVFVDSESGAIVFRNSNEHSVKRRAICDAGNTDTALPCVVPVRVENGPSSGQPDVDAAFANLGTVYDFYYNRFGRDSYDDQGSTMNSTVRYCTESFGTCPMNNAFWSGSQHTMTFGESIAQVDDIVGHEMTHAFTEHSSNLMYWFQPGAINESISDVMGELIDQTNSRGNDTAGVRWMLGEDNPSGAYRNMANPPAMGDPDRMTSTNYYTPSNTRSYDSSSPYNDSGGVHTNSGVNNKAAYLMTDGGTFNGQTVRALGGNKVSALYYVVSMAYLTSGSDYKDLANGLRATCDAMVLANSFAFTSSDCEQVDKALVAVEMDVDPPAAPTEDVPYCDANDAEPRAIYHNGFEQDADGWTPTTNNAKAGWYIADDYAHDGFFSMGGVGAATASLSTLRSPVIGPLPAGAHLRFMQAWNFESDATRNYDGSKLEYRVAGGTWHDAGPLIESGGYTGTIDNKTGNPLGGDEGWTDNSRGYTSTRLDLSSLAGSNLEFRFSLGSDATVAFGLGWYIDSFDVYDCVTKRDETKPDPGRPAPGSTTSPTPTPGSSTTPPSNAGTPTTKPQIKRVVVDKSKRRVTIQISRPQGYDFLQCRVDKRAWRACSTKFVARKLKRGRHSIAVRIVADDGTPGHSVTTKVRI